MSRFLFVVPPLTSHLNPAAAIAGELSAQGHAVAWAGPETILRPILGPTATIYRTGTRMYRGIRDRGTSPAQAFLDGYVVPLARFTLAAVDKAVREFEPDVVVVDQHGVAGALVAHRHGLRWASLLPSSMGLFPDRAAEFDAWLAGSLAKLWAEAELPPASDETLLSMMFSPYLQLAFTTTALTGEAPAADHVKLVGPALCPRLGEPAVPVDWLDPDRALVLVTVGTLNVDVATDFYQRAVQALAGLGDRLQGIVLAPPDILPDPPDHVAVLPRVDVLALMPHLAAVVSHGGANTVGEALSHGIPLVVAPITLDQPRTAEQVVRAGAGIRVDFNDATPAVLREAMTAVLDDERYRAAAERIRDSFTAAGGAAAAAGHLSRLAR